MIDDLLGELFGELVFGRITPSRRAQLLARMFFGLLGAGLSGAGVYMATFAMPEIANPAFRASIIAVFTFFGSFWLFNVALGRQWGWTWKLFVVSFVAMFAIRIVGGA